MREQILGRFIRLLFLGALTLAPAEAAGGDYFARLRADDAPMAGRFTVHAYVLDTLDVAVEQPAPGRILLLEFREANGDNSFIVPGDLQLKDRRGRSWTRGFHSLETGRLAGFLDRDASRWALWWVPTGVDSFQWSAPTDLGLWYGFTKASFAPLDPREARKALGRVPWDRIRAAELDPDRSVADLGDAIDPAAFDEPPTVLERRNPVYPRSARLYDFTGTVHVVAVVDERGEVADVFVLQSSAAHDLNAAALAAVSKWKFKAGTKEGKPVRGGFLVPVSFARGRDD